MADTKISALPASTTPLAGTEVLPIVQSSATKQVSVSNLTAGRAVSAASLALTTSPLPATSGGTGSSSAFTANGVMYASSTSVLATGSSLVFDGTNLLVGNTTGTSRLSVNLDNSTAYAGVAPNAANCTAAFTNGAVHTTGGTFAGYQFNISGNSQNRIGYIGAISESTSNQGLSLVFGVNSTGGSRAEALRISSASIVTMSGYGVGTATFSAAGVISSVSDETWKIKDGVPTDPDAMLKKLEPGYWYYNDKKKEIFGTDRQLGFYAQNVNAAIGPEAAPVPETFTTKDDDGIETTVTKPWGYYDRSVLAVTVMSLQKALATIESLTSRIIELEKS